MAKQDALQGSLDLLVLKILSRRALNRAIGALVSLGFGPAHIWVLEVRGRTSGRIRATPVDLNYTSHFACYSPLARNGCVATKKGCRKLPLQ